MKLMVKIFALWLSFVCVVGWVYADDVEKRSSAGDADLDQEIRWLQAEAYVLTASKRAERLDLAPSVMTVYTDEDIRRQGLRNMNEVLDRTVGFFTNRNKSNNLISNRGIVSDENEPFLLLIDGHNMNSIVDKGAGDYFLFPLISHAKQIEIVRGPGSTLWGSDASLGVIHVITKDGKDINGFETSVDYASEDRYRYANVLYGRGNEVNNNDVMFSFTYAESDGFPEGGYESYEAVWGPMQKGPIDKINDSWEFYGKMKQDGFTFTARACDLMNLNMDRTQYISDGAVIPYDFSDFNDYYNRRRHYMLNVAHEKDIADDIILETKVFTDLMERWQGVANPNISSGLNYSDSYFISNETRLGMEMTLKIDFFKDHHILTGIQGVQTEVDPIYYRIAYITFVEDPEVIYEDATILVKPDDDDLNLAAYVEDNWTLTDDLHLILGLRVDHNNLREDSSKILPRVAVIYDFCPAWTVKYLYNTGYVRPPIAKSYLSQHPAIEMFYTDINGNLAIGTIPIIGSTESEEVFTHDLQLAYTSQKIKANLTGYHTIFKNAFNFSGVTGLVDGEEHVIFYVNSNTITSNGIEFDARLTVNSYLDIYGNYAHVISSKIDKYENSAEGISYTLENMHLFTDDRTMAKFPHNMWNLGLDIFPMANISLNLHYRGWANAWAELVDSPGEYEELGPEHFVDANLRFTNLPGNTSIALYAKNLLNNDDAGYPLLLSDGWVARSRSVGGKITFTF